MSEGKTFGIDKGVLRAFALMVVLVGVLTTFFLSEYVSTILLGSVFYTAVNGTTYSNTPITGEAFIVYNISNEPPTELANNNILSGTLTVYNATDDTLIGLNNFTIDYVAGNISLKATGATILYNATTLSTNYTYQILTTINLPISSDANTLIGTQEDDFVTTFTSVNTGVKFAAALITVVAVILVFVSFLPKKGGKGDSLGY